MKNPCPDYDRKKLPDESNRFWVGTGIGTHLHAGRVIQIPHAVVVEVRRLSRFQWRLVGKHGPGAWGGIRKLRHQFLGVKFRWIPLTGDYWRGEAGVKPLETICGVCSAKSFQ